MKIKFTALVVVILSSFAFSACSEEEINPIHTDEAKADGLAEDEPIF